MSSRTFALLGFLGTLGDDGLLQVRYIYATQNFIDTSNKNCVGNAYVNCFGMAENAGNLRYMLHVSNKQPDDRCFTTLMVVEWMRTDHSASSAGVGRNYSTGYPIEEVSIVVLYVANAIDPEEPKAHFPRR
ncbi:hypothetical protein F4801DRAFT_213280 [Xylaria longipes]|nr:hypothetical protein F4801DRAFT_213280 [Xylaria longipes]